MKRSVLCGLLACLFTGCRGSAKQEPINVVLISIDSLRADHVHAYGYNQETTPTLDRLAREGALFETVISDSSWTLPTHISMLTGLTSQVHGVTNDVLRTNHSRTILAEWLRERGYRTWGLYSGPYLHPFFGFDKGFDTYQGVAGKTAYDGRKLGDYLDRLDAESIPDASAMSHRSVTSPEVTEKACELLSQRAEEPFFLFLHYFDVHYDYVPPEEVWRRFDPDYAGTLTAEDFIHNPALHEGMSDGDLKHLIALYDGEIFFTDRQIGFLIDALERNGLAENTLVVVTSDHGEEFLEHGELGHRKTLYDEVLRVPLILRLPGRIGPGQRIQQQVRQIDVMPTILSLLGLELPEGLQGVPLGAVLEGTESPTSLDAVSRLVKVPGREVIVSIRTRALKYIATRQSAKETEQLFDLERDPEEQRPLLQRESRWHGPNVANRFFTLRDLLLRRERESLSLKGSGKETGSGKDQELPPEIREQLRSLGYVP